MIVDTDSRLFYRSIFNFKDADQHQRALDWLQALPGKVYVRQNRYAEHSLVCDFQFRKERDIFDATVGKF